MKSQELIGLVEELLEQFGLESESYKETLALILNTGSTNKEILTSTSLRQIKNALVDYKERMEELDDYSKECERLANPKYLTEREYFMGILLALVKEFYEQRKGESGRMYG